jgi:UDP-N-acetylmuramoyl-tripeptide--D-alanyl-D-alanine ligase
MAARTSDLAVFIGEHGYRAVKSACAAGMAPDRVLSFLDLRRASDYLASELRAGDFVLLRGRGTDHISRVVLAQLGTIGCWKTWCEKTIVCDLCSELKPEFDLQTTLQTL